MILANKINQQRLWHHLMELAEIGSSPDNAECITRLSLSEPELKARAYIISLMEEIGLDVRVDTIGNIIGKLTGEDQTAPSVLVGSHIDTVYHGGRFDGSLGVIGAIEAVRTIIESGVTLTHSIEVVSFTDEEGSRFGTGYIGSKAMAGHLKEEIFNYKDENGISYREAFIKANLDPDNYKQAIRNPMEIKAYLEMHIEQAKVLEENDLPVGIVTDIQGPVWLDITLNGDADHAGATPMHMRKDASIAMAEIVIAIEKIATSFNGVGTVGIMKVEPGGVNIIPGKASFSVDLRHADKAVRQKMVDSVYQAIELSCDKRGIGSLVEVKKAVDPASCSNEIVNILEETCEDLNIDTMRLNCGAGHDSLIMSKITKMGMIFVRSKDGISHNPKEWSSSDDCAAGTEVVYHSLLNLAK